MIWFIVVVAALWTVFSTLAVIVTFPFSEWLGHKSQRLWGKGCLWLFGVHVTLEGAENLPHGGMIIAPNHQSNFDIFVVASLPIDFKWVAKKEVRAIPFVGWAMKSMDAYFVKRDRSGSDLEVMKKVEEDLRSGKSILIFPEGTRTRTGEMLPFKKGAFRTAQNSGVPLCPIGIKGTYTIAPAGQIPTHLGHPVRVRIGQPFFVGKDETLAQSMGKFRQVLSHLIE